MAARAYRSNVWHWAALAAVLCLLASIPASAESSSVSANIRVDQSVYTASLYDATSDVRVVFAGTVEIQSERGNWVNLELEAAGVPWPVSLSPTSFTSQRDAQFRFTGTIDVPRQAAEGSYAITIFGNDTASPLPVHSQTSFSVSVYRGPLALEAVLDTPLPRAGETAIWSLWVRNLASFELDYDPHFVVPSGFSYTASIPGTQIIQPGAQARVLLNLTPAPSVPEGDYAWSVSVDSASHPEIVATLSAPFMVQPTLPPLPAESQDILVRYWFPITIGIFAVGAVMFLSLTEIGYFSITFTLLAPLFTRLKRDKVLDNFTRGQIYGYIRANPGAHYSAIQQVLDVENGVLAYHLRVLLRENYLVARNEGVFKRFYPRDHKLPKRRALLTRLQVDILEEVAAAPGISQRDVARALGESKQVVSYNVGVLRDAGMLAADRRGRDVLLRPSDDGRRALTEPHDESGDAPLGTDAGAL
jgi:predicted transcriptional regulator